MNVTVLGMGPLPGQESDKTHAPGIRTAQFVRGLIAGGHDVSLAVRTHTEAGIAADAAAPSDLPVANYQSFSDEEFMTGDTLRRVIGQWAPRALVAVTFLPSFRAAKIAGDFPVWMDLFGEPLAEGQAKAALLGDDEVIQPYYDMLMPILQRGDRFSAVSRAQANALEGQLALAGRMSRRTAYYRTVHTIPCALDPTVSRASTNPLRGTLVPEDAFVVLWSGGFNTWCDVDTLYLGIEKAMSHNDKIHFVSTGGALGEQDSSTYAHFANLVDRSTCKARYHLEGWIPYSRLGDYYGLADVAVNSDRSLLEVRLGTKTRFMEWIACHIPIITSRLSELSRDLERTKGALGFAPGDGEALATHLLWAAANPEGLTTISSRAHQFATSRLTAESTVHSTSQWARRPRRAPDWRGGLGLMQAGELRMRRELELTQNHVRNLDETIAHLKEAVEGARHETDLARQETEEVRGQVTKAEEKSVQFEGEISKLIADRDHWKENSAKLQERLTTQDQDFTRLRDGLDQQIQQQRELLDEVAKQLRYWEGIVRKRDSRISELETKAAEVQREHLEMQGQITTLRREIERLTAGLADREQQVAELSAWGERVRGTLPYKMYKFVKRGS
ncbi:hypothetical protein JXA88_09040 [Candidatus Fermentibacteria bacterium]|nr:hypothetical protein [Candidatus Fermentibacteria bacterium]